MLLRSLATLVLAAGLLSGTSADAGVLVTNQSNQAWTLWLVRSALTFQPSPDQPMSDHGPDAGVESVDVADASGQSLGQVFTLQPQGAVDLAFGDTQQTTCEIRLMDHSGAADCTLRLRMDPDRGCVFEADHGYGAQAEDRSAIQEVTTQALNITRDAYPPLVSTWGAVSSGMADHAVLDDAGSSGDFALPPPVIRHH